MQPPQSTATTAQAAGTTERPADTPPETAPPPPDLAVVTGDDPGANVREAVAILGGMERFVSRGARVVLKPNVLTGRAPEYAATTNPDVVREVAVLCYEAGAGTVTVLDRPTAPSRTAFEVSGIAAAAAAADATVKHLSDRNFERIEIPEGRLLTDWPLVTDLFEADTVINIPIAKHHSMAGLTMAMKNLMGVMGGGRGLIHLDFPQKIVDLNTLVRPHLVILDAYRMLLDHGPTGGRLEDVRLARTVVVGTSQVSVDAYGATLFDRRPEELAYLRLAAEQGLGVIDTEALRIERREV